jgi:N-acetylglucosamine-6-phosphate deacetylase
MRRAYKASEIFTGESILINHHVIVEDGWIEKIFPASEMEPGLTVTDLGDVLLLPGLIDAQVYGAAGFLFAQYPSAETLRAMNEAFIQTGTVAFLPTIASNPPATIKKCIDAVRSYFENGGKGVMGLHLEGPWFNEKKRGAHLKEWIHPPTKQEVQDLLEYGEGVIRVITLAPEVCDEGIIEIILEHGVIVSAGHSDATYAESMAGFRKGIRNVTHLYNAMSSLHHREPGLVGATLQHADVLSSIIPDGHHVSYEAVAIAKKIMGHRLFAITDAVTETSEGPYQHYRAGDKYECNGILSGSALSMYQAFKNLVEKVSISVEESARMCSLYPSIAIGCSNRYGKIAPGYAGQFLAIDKQLELAAVIT